MPMPVHELEAEAVCFATADRAQILERLIESFERDTKIGEALVDEALRFDDEVISGKVRMVSVREAVSRIRPPLVSPAKSALQNRYAPHERSLSGVNLASGIP